MKDKEQVSSYENVSPKISPFIFTIKTEKLNEIVKKKRKRKTVKSEKQRSMGIELDSFNL